MKNTSVYLHLCNNNNINSNNHNWFLYNTFLVWDTIQSVLQWLPPVIGFNINPALIVYLLNSLGSILARRHFRGAHMPNQATSYIRILPGTHLYTRVKSSNVDIVSCWRTTKVPGIDGNQTHNPLIVRFSPIYHGTSTNNMELQKGYALTALCALQIPLRGNIKPAKLQSV